VKPALAVCAVALALAGCSHSPTEPDDNPRPSSNFTVLSHDFPATVRRGEVVTVTISAVGLSGIGSWSNSGLQLSIGGRVFELPDPWLVAYEGSGVARFIQAESGGIDIVVYGKTFTQGSRLSATAKLHVRNDAPTGPLVLNLLAGVDNGAQGHLEQTSDVRVTVAP
jgi:hypothetical protein